MANAAKDLHDQRQAHTSSLAMNSRIDDPSIMISSAFWRRMKASRSDHNPLTQNSSR